MIWIILLILLILAIVAGFKYLINEGGKIQQKELERQERQKQRRLIACEEYEKELTDLSNKFGECAINENLSSSSQYNISTRVLVYEQSSTIIIKLKEYKFSDILGYSLVDDATSETITTSTGTAKTSTGSMLGRAVVGGVLTGGLGAVAGAATAKKNISDNATSQTTTTHKYTLYINVNSLQEPTIALEIGNNASKAQKLAGVINVIVERNKQIAQ